MDRWLKTGSLKVSVYCNKPSTSSNGANATNMPDEEEMRTEDPDVQQNHSSFQNVESPASKTIHISIKRKYDETYLVIGFMDTQNCPQCVICGIVLPNSSMGPAKLRRHFETNHPKFQNKNVDLFERNVVSYQIHKRT